MEQNQLVSKEFFKRPDVQAKFTEIMGKRAPQFITSIMQIVNSNESLKKCEPVSIMNAAITAAVLNLPINQNLGFAYIIPYKTKVGNEWKDLASFQMGYKGFIQLAQRSGQFKTLSATPIYEGQIISENPLTGYVFDFTIKSEKIIGYAAYFELLNGFSKLYYMSKEQTTSHGLKFSKTFAKGFGLWKDDFDSMSLKTVTKLLLSKFAPLSIEMEKAIVLDQSVVKDTETMEAIYVDNQTLSIEEVNDEKEKQRIIDFIDNCTTEIQLKSGITTDILIKYDLNEYADFKLENLKTKTNAKN